MKKYLGLAIGVTMLLGLSMGFSSSTVFVQSESDGCNGVGIGEADANISVNGSEVSVEGLYCANTGGYGLLEQSITQDGDEINAVFRLSSPSDQEFVTQVITPVEFEALDEFEDGEYDVSYEVIVDEEVVNSDNSTVQIEESQSTSMMARFRTWISGFFS
ncbi:MAG: hypothetical protein R6V35_05185 [Candidatus Nanohaloarchaea archaeon]